MLDAHAVTLSPAETFVMNLEGMSLKLPSVFQTSFMGAKLWQWSALLCVLLLAILLTFYRHF